LLVVQQSYTHGLEVTLFLKPLNQYPRANVTVIVKAPNGEPVSNGTVCALLAPPVFLPFVFSPT